MKILFTIVLVFVFHFSFAQINYTEFIGKKTKMTFFKEFTFANLYDYQANASTKDSLIVQSNETGVAEDYFMKKYAKKLESNTKDSIFFVIVLKSKLTINITKIRHKFIKFKLISDNIESNFQVIDLIENNDGWIENKNVTDETSTVKEALRIASVDLFYLFFNKRGNNQLISNLKPLAKEHNGIINIKKFVRVIKENKASLSKYLDE